MNTSIFKGKFFVKKFVSAIIIVSFIFSLVPVPPALALRNPQAGNAPAMGRAIGNDIGNSAGAVGGVTEPRSLNDKHKQLWIKFIKEAFSMFAPGTFVLIADGDRQRAAEVKQKIIELELGFQDVRIFDPYDYADYWPKLQRIISEVGRDKITVVINNIPHSHPAADGITLYLSGSYNIGTSVSLIATGENIGQLPNCIFQFPIFISDNTVDKIYNICSRYFTRENDTHEDRKRKALDLICGTDIAGYRELREILLKSRKVAKDIKSLLDNHRLFQILPILASVQSVDKAVSEGEGNYLTHTLAVIKHFEEILHEYNKAIQDKNYPYNGKYQGELLTSDDLSEYAEAAQRLLSEDREFVFLMLLLHDIGTVIDVGQHDLEGVDLIEAVMEKLGFDKTKTERAKWFITNHTAIGVIATRERTPKYLTDRIGGIPEEEVNLRFKLLTLLAICDLRSMDDGKYFKKDVLKFYKKIWTKDDLEKSQQRWHISRLAVFESQDNFGCVDDWPENSQFKVLYERLSPQEQDAFRKNFGEFIERFNYAIRPFWQYNNKETLWKLLYLMNQIIQEVKAKDIVLRTAEVTFPPDRFYDVKKSISQLASAFTGKFLEQIKEAVHRHISPMQLTRDMEKSFSIYGLPVQIRIDPTDKLIISFGVDKIAEAGANGEMALQRRNLEKLFSLAETTAKKMDDIKAKIAKNATEGNKQWFGLVAERLMFILRDIKAVREFITAADPMRSPPQIDLSNYQNEIDEPKGPGADVIVRYGLVDVGNIRNAAEVAQIGKQYMPITVNVLMAGGAGARLQELYEMSKEERRGIGAGDLEKEELKNVSKPTVPYSKIKHKSPITVILESLKKIARETKADVPVVVITGPDTEGPILESLRKNNYFGLKHVITRSQGALPAYKTYDKDGNITSWSPVEFEPDGRYIEAPDGGGGTVMALAEKGINVVNDGLLQHLNDKSVLEWLDENFPSAEDISFLQTDMALEPEAIYGLAGARIVTKTGISVLAYDYPREITVKVKRDNDGRIIKIFVEDEFVLGTFFSAGHDSAEILEYAERTRELQDLVYNTRFGITKDQLQDKLDKLIQNNGGTDAINQLSADAQKDLISSYQTEINQLISLSLPNGLGRDVKIPSNAGAFNLKKADVEAVIKERKLKPYVQAKRERRKKDGKTFTMDNLEWFITKLPQAVSGGTSIAFVDEGDALPTKDPKKFVESRNYYATRHRERLKNEFGVTNIGEDAVIEFSQLFKGSIDPSLKIGKDARLYLGGSYTGDGYEINIGKNVEIADGVTVIIEGDGHVAIKDGTKFTNGTYILSARAGAIGALAEFYGIDIEGKTDEQVQQELARRLIEDNLVNEKPLRGRTADLKEESHEAIRAVRALQNLLTANRDELIMADPHATLEGPGKLALAYPNAEITVAGDLLDRGKDLLRILSLGDKLFSNLVWGDHDLWALGAILGNDLLLAQWIQINYRYNNEYVLTDLGLDMERFKKFADDKYGKFAISGSQTGDIDEGIAEAPKGANNIYALTALNMFMKLRGNVCALARIPDGQIALNGRSSNDQPSIIGEIRKDAKIEDSELPEDEKNALREHFSLTKEERGILDDFHSQFASSEKMQRLRKVLMKGRLFRIIPEEPAIHTINKKLTELLGNKWKNLPTVVVLHNVPATDKNGEFVDIHGNPIKNLKNYYEELEKKLRGLNTAYEEAVALRTLAAYRSEKAAVIDELQSLADGINSPVYGRDSSQRGPSVYCSTSDHYVVKKIGEPKNPSANFIKDDDSGFGRKIAEAFGVKRVIVSHDPGNEQGLVRLKEGGLVLMADPYFAAKKGGQEGTTGKGAAVLVSGDAIKTITLDPEQRDQLKYVVEIVEGDKTDVDWPDDKLTVRRSDYIHGRSALLTPLIHAAAAGEAKERFLKLLTSQRKDLDKDDTRLMLAGREKRNIEDYIMALPDDNPLLLPALIEIMERLKRGEERAIVDENHPAFNGLTDDVRRLLLQAGATSAVESAYEKKIVEFTHRIRTVLSDAEIRDLLKALPDEKASEFLMVLRGYGFDDVLNRIETIFKTIERSLSTEAQKAYRSAMSGNVICPLTKLALGDPHVKPFPVIADSRQMDLYIDNLMTEMEYEDAERFAVKSASGIRSIFDYYLRRDGTSMRISDASKMHAAIITEAFIGFLKRYPAYLKKHKEEKESAPTIIIGSDTRSTSPAISNIIIRTLLSLGIKANIKYLGICSVSEIVAYAQSPQAGADAFIYVSASHNPKGNNGVKLGFADGKLLDPFLAKRFINEFKDMFTDRGLVRKTIDRLNNVAPTDINNILQGAPENKRESKKVYDAFSDRVMKNKAEMRKEVKKRGFYFVVDSNGGARAKQESRYYRTLGYKVVEINSRARYDMNHDLCPRNEACADLEEVINQLIGEGKNVVGGLVFDTDGDRQNFVFVDKDGRVRPLGVQGMFALNVLCALMEQIIDKGINEPSEASVVVNDATSIMLENMAGKAGFGVQRCETGEPIVVETGEKLHDVLGRTVVMMGEGSNGGSFTLDLKVREPRHAIRTITTLLLRPELFSGWCEHIGMTAPKTYTIADIIRTLPIEYSTDFFDEREVRRRALPIPPKLLKAQFEAYFAKYMWPEIKNIFAKEKPLGIERRDLKYQFVRNEGRPLVKVVDGKVTVVSESRGPYNEMTELGTGGLKVEILSEGKAIAWLWFRKSGTEPLQRRGASVSLWLDSADNREIKEDAIRGVRRVLNDDLHRLIGAVEKKVQRDIIKTLSEDPQTSAHRREFILAYAYEKDPESALKKIGFPEDRLADVLDEVQALKQKIDSHGDLAVEARAIIENNEQLFNRALSHGIKLGWLIVKVLDVSGLKEPCSTADIYSGALIVRINSELKIEDKVQLGMALNNIKEPSEAALVIGPDDNNRARAVTALSGIYERVFEAEDADSAKQLASAEDDAYTVTHIVDLTKIYIPQISITRQIRNNFGMVELITIGDPNRIEEIIRQNL